MRWLNGHSSDIAAPSAETSGRCWIPPHCRRVHCNAQSRCGVRHAASALSQPVAPRHAHLRHGVSICHAKRSAGTAAAPLSSPVAVLPEDAGVSQAGSVKTFDVVHLGNLCLDVIVPVDELPSDDTGVRAALLADLTARPPPEPAWEVGGASNFMIAAARLGQRVASVGQLADDVYGTFFRRVMQSEGVQTIEALSPEAALEFATLLCFVLVSPAGGHAFTSAYDFGPWPLLAGVLDLQPRVLEVLRDTRALMLNGFVLDELPGPLVVAAARATRAAGGSVFFDPGPRSWTLLEGQRRKALDAILDVADVVLMTQEEAEAVTGEADPAAAGVWVLGRPGAVTAWAAIKLGPGGALLCARGAAAPIHVDAIRVPVKDTVGCGDSFAAAIALGFTHGHSPEATLALANAVGAATATGRGAGRSVARAEMVLSLLEAQAAGRPESAGATSRTATTDAAVHSAAEAASLANSSGGVAPAAAAGGHVGKSRAAAVPGDGVRWPSLQPNPAAAAIQLLEQSLDAAAGSVTGHRS